MGVMALVTHLIGVHTVLGAFVAGILVGESPILTRHIDEQLRGLVVALFMPVFFALAGLNAAYRFLRIPDCWGSPAGLSLSQASESSAGPFWAARSVVERSGIDGVGLRYERAWLDRSHRRFHRPVARLDQSGFVHDDRDDGDRHHTRNAAQSALGVVEASAA
jgi:hypothetical protein